MEQMTCAARMIRPFVQVLASRADRSSLELERFESSALDQRIPLHLAHEAIRRWVERTENVDLGLEAGRRMSVGSGGALEFAMHSAQTVRDALSIAHKYHRLFSDALEPKLVLDGTRATLEIESHLFNVRAIGDFVMSTWYRSHVRSLLSDASEIECLFAHPQPEDLRQYRATFGSASLCFDTAHYGFRFGAELADAPLTSGDRALHEVHCEHLEAIHAGLREPSVTQRVRELLTGELRRGRPNALRVARRMHMSRRTMVRRLAREGTSFIAELDGVRHELALRFVRAPEPSLLEVSELLGFSHVQGFHRAFKRWTGQTPRQFRSASFSANWAQGAGPRSEL
jgi:AraC-like DNA-binding protein